MQSPNPRQKTHTSYREEMQFKSRIDACKQKLIVTVYLLIIATNSSIITVLTILFYIILYYIYIYIYSNFNHNLNYCITKIPIYSKLFIAVIVKEILM